MNRVKLCLKSFEDVESFVQTMRHFDGEYDLAIGSYTVDAKSILGVIAIGVGRVLDFVIVNLREDHEADVLHAVERFRRAA